jgi:ribose transport system ATP-binding protein
VTPVGDSTATSAHDGNEGKMPPDVLIALDGIDKSFSGTQVLKNVSLDLAAGEIHGLIGQNGCGKSTIVKILSGYHVPEAGSCTIRGVPTKFPIANQGLHGLTTIHQELALCGPMTVAENFGIQTGYGSGWLSPISWRREGARLRKLADQVGVTLPTTERVDRISPAERAFTAILRALLVAQEAGQDQPIIILDEPTVFLADAERDKLFSVLRRTANAGGALLLVSHRLKEVVQSSDRISVMRDGEIVTTVQSADTDIESLSQAMLDNQIRDFYPTREKQQPGQPVRLRAKNVSGTSLQDLTLELREGEILGVTGLAGMGQDELPYLLIGERDRASRRHLRLMLDGKNIPQPNAGRMARAGVALVPAERARDAIWLRGAAFENLTISDLRLYEGAWWLGGRRARKAAEGLLTRFGVRPPDPRMQLRAFSGGNQQKIVIARLLGGKPLRVLLLHEPTQGVDIGARKQILELLCESASQGVAIAIFSSDHEQIAAMCDRVLVLRDGQITGEISASDVSEEAIARMAQGNQS